MTYHWAPGEQGLAAKLSQETRTEKGNLSLGQRFCSFAASIRTAAVVQKSSCDFKWFCRKSMMGKGEKEHGEVGGKATKTDTICGARSGHQQCSHILARTRTYTFSSLLLPPYVSP